MPQMSQVLRERAIGMLTAGMSTRAVARELNVNFSTISRLKGVSENLAVQIQLINTLYRGKMEGKYHLSFSKYNHFPCIRINTYPQLYRNSFNISN